MTKRKLALVFLVVLTTLMLAPLAYYLFLRSDSDALWRILSQECLATEPAQQTNASCVKVDRQQSYVLFKDRRGPHHDLLMPTYPVAGLESEELGREDVPRFMEMAWAERSRLSQEAGIRIPDDYLSFAINSQWGRTQHHLHIHIACLHPSAYETITQLAPGISFDWAPLAEQIEGSHYIARRISRDAFANVNPIALLNEYLRAEAIPLGNYGLAIMQLQDGDFVLLATGMNLLAFDLGSAGELQDFECALARSEVIDRD